jgi:hypothetical protein
MAPQPLAARASRRQRSPQATAAGCHSSAGRPPEEIGVGACGKVAPVAAHGAVKLVKDVVAFIEITQLRVGWGGARQRGTRVGIRYYWPVRCKTRTDQQKPHARHNAAHPAQPCLISAPRAGPPCAAPCCAGSLHTNEPCGRHTHLAAQALVHGVGCQGAGIHVDVPQLQGHVVAREDVAAAGAEPDVVDGRDDLGEEGAGALLRVVKGVRME